MLSIYLLRHAETDYNADNKFVGGRSNHLSLSAKGEKQAVEIGKVLGNSNIRFDKVFCSVANRTQQTLEIILSQAHITNEPIILRRKYKNFPKATGKVNLALKYILQTVCWKSIPINGFLKLRMENRKRTLKNGCCLLFLIISSTNIQKVNF